MALLKHNEVHKNSAPFDGYWSLGPMIIDPFEKQCRVQLGLFWDLASYNLNAKENVLRLSDTYIIAGAEYDTIFPQGIPPEEMPSLAAIMYQIFAFIKAQTDIDGNPGYFATSEIVA